MGKFNEISQGQSPSVFYGITPAERKERLRIIYMRLKRSGMAVGSTGVVSAVRARSKTIALNVVGKPNKVRVSKNSIKSITKDNGCTLLFLIGRNEPLMLRDSAEEVENKVRWANGY